MLMPAKRLLLLSNSTNYGSTFLKHALDEISGFLGDQVRNVLFIPYAAVRFSYDTYETRVSDVLGPLGYGVRSIHREQDRLQAVERAEAIMVGGGNTFHLVHLLYEERLLDAIRNRIEQRIPYVGWSAGANVACPTLCTTNDMPIIEPQSFRTLNLVPFQINPHYTDAHPEGHKGETRDERIAEYVEINPGVNVVGLREGSMLRIENGQIHLTGTRPVRVFTKGREAVDYSHDDSIQFLLT